MTKREQARELKRQGLTVRQIAKRLGIAASTATGYTKGTHQSKPKLTTDYTDTTGRVELISTVQTLDDALDKAGVDRSVWEVDRWVCNSYEQASKDDSGSVSVTPLWQIKVYLRRKAAQSLAMEAVVADLSESPHRPKSKPHKPRRDKGCLLNISIPDLHVGKRPIAGEYPVEKIMDYCIETILSRASGVGVSLIHLPIGSDLLNVDGPHETTTRGTPQSQSQSFEQAATRAVRLLIATIDRLKEIATVKVTAVPGNHDRASTYWIGQILAAWYRDDGRVEVEAPGPFSRVYLRFGATLLMTHHGDAIKTKDVESIMIRERPKDFAECVFREAHSGHLHTAGKKRLHATDTIGTVTARQLPSLSPTDAWHDQMGFVGSPRFAEAHVYDPVEGPILSITATPPQEWYGETRNSQEEQ